MGSGRGEEMKVSSFVLAFPARVSPVVPVLLSSFPSKL